MNHYFEGQPMSEDERLFQRIQVQKQQLITQQKRIRSQFDLIVLQREKLKEIDQQKKKLQEDQEKLQSQIAQLTEEVEKWKAKAHSRMYNVKQNY